MVLPGHLNIIRNHFATVSIFLFCLRHLKHRTLKKNKQALPLGLVCREPDCQTSEPGLNPVNPHPNWPNISCKPCNIMHALKNHYITCKITSPIKNRCSRSTHSVASVPVPQSTLTEFRVYKQPCREVSVISLCDSIDVGRQNHYADAREKEIRAID